MRGGSIALALAGVVAAGALWAQPAKAGVNVVVLEKVLGNQQTGPGTVTPTGAQFFAILGSGAGDFDGASMAFPGPSSPQSLANTGPGSFTYVSPILASAALDAAFPAGDYTFTATNSVTLASQVVDATYDPTLPPSVVPAWDPVTFTALQNLDPSVGMTLDFNSSGGAGVEIIGTDVTHPGTKIFFLSPTDTSFFVPAGSVHLGDTYDLTLAFVYSVFTPPAPGGVPVVNAGIQATTETFTVPGAAPEPASWAIMLVGVCGLGAVARRRSRAARPA